MDPASTLQGSGSVLPPLLISLTGIVGCSLAIVVYHLLIVRYCMSDNGEENAENPTANAQDPALIAGVEPKILETIPIVSFSRKNVAYSDSDQTECTVCLGELEEGEIIRVLPICSHIFHVSCIDHWFRAHTNCPICRSPVVTTDFTEESPERNMDAEDERVFEVVSPLSFHGHDHELQADSTPTSISNSNFTPGVPSKIVLRHCVSLVFPRETKQKHLITGLNRSLSMDQSYVLINLIEENEKDSSPSSSVSKCNSYRARSMRQLDRMSSLLKSLSQWRIGKSGTINGILPY